MAGSFNLAAGVMTFTKDGRVAFDISRPLMNLVPSAAITLTSKAIVFPDLLKGAIYHKYRYTPPVGTDFFANASFAGIIAQEWGPSEGGGFALADEVIGTVPVGTDYLDVMVNLTNTTIPAGWYDIGMKTNFPSGDWVKLEGGSCRIEHFPGLRRLFEIVLVGTDVVLRRYQSVSANGPVQRVGSFGTGNVSGYVAGSGAPTASGQYAIYGALIQTRGPSGSGSDSSWNPGGANASSTTPPSYASTWTGDIIITPGRISA